MLMELAIAVFNARLYVTLGSVTSLSVQAEPTPPRSFVGRQHEVAKQDQRYGRCRAKPSSSLRLEREGRNALLEVWI